jgi:hypothetical protein
MKRWFLNAMTLLAAGLVLVAGCATKPIDWSARVGHYTFDQTVLELGPPDKQQPLKDGTLVAEWLTRRGYHQVYSVGGYYGAPGYHGGYYSPTFVGTRTPDSFLRLTFNPDGQLAAWKKLAR